MAWTPKQEEEEGQEQAAVPGALQLAAVDTSGCADVLQVSHEWPLWRWEEIQGKGCVPSCTAAAWQSGWSQGDQERSSLELDFGKSSCALCPFRDLRDNRDTYLWFFPCRECEYMPLIQLLLLTSNVGCECVSNFIKLSDERQKKGKKIEYHYFWIKLLDEK